MNVPVADPRDDPRNANLPLVNQPETILGTTITFLCVAIIAASLRLWSRFRDRLWSWDDSFVVLACIASIAGDSIVCMMASSGLGLHLYTFNETYRERYFKHVWSSKAAYSASTTLIKLAILLQYLRLFAETTISTSSPQYRLARRCTWAVTIASALWGLTFLCLALFSCQPIAKNWKPTLEGKCIGWGSKNPNEVFAMWAAHAATNMFLDVVVLLLPIPFLGTLRLQGKSKMGLLSLFAMGSIVAGVSIGRMVALCVNRAGTVPVPDMSYYTPLAYIFSVLEVNIAILCASIPIFWPMISELAGTKILVVNEIVVHVENYPKRGSSFDGDPGIGLSEQGAWKSPDSSVASTPQVPPSRLSSVARSFDRRRSSRDSDTMRAAKRRSKASLASSSVRRSFSRSTTPHNNNTSSNNNNNNNTVNSNTNSNHLNTTITTTNIEPRWRCSHESQRHLYHATSREQDFLSKSDLDWFTELDRDCVSKRTKTTIETGDPFAGADAATRF